MTLGDRLERRPEVSERLDVIELAGLDEAGDAGPGLRAFVVSCEQMILSAKSQRTDAILNRGCCPSQHGRQRGTPAARPSSWRCR